jgi:hypothetical protein
MPHYSFTISGGGQSRPSSISDCANDDSARKEAAGMFADMARDISERLRSTPDWQIEVADDTGKSIFRIKITAESLT